MIKIKFAFSKLVYYIDKNYDNLKMWQRKFSKIYPNTKKDKVWQIWADVNNWPKWHDDLEYCKLEGKFVQGNYFTLKPKGAPAVKIKLLEVIPNKKFVDCTAFIGAKMYDTHILEEMKDGLKISNEIKVTGFLGFLWVLLVAKKIAKTAPQEMDKVARIAQQ